MEIMEGLAGKPPNYIHNKFLGTHHCLYMEKPKDITKDPGYVTDDDDDDTSAAILENAEWFQ